VTREQVDMLFAFDARAISAPVPAAELVADGAARFRAKPANGVACSHCHLPELDGQDGATHGRNTPPLRDVARQLLFGWDGALTELEAAVRRALRWRHGNVDEGEVAAISAYLRSWRSRGRWDRFVEGDDTALSPAERAGLATFVTVGCAACHSGRLLGGRSRHALGAAVAAPSDDEGYSAVTGLASDRLLFRAPALRLAARTAPYLHDGSLATLEQAIEFMGQHELGVALSAAQVAAIANFLRAVADLDDVEGQVAAMPR
jgi:cytochrome c peroxidase